MRKAEEILEFNFSAAKFHLSAKNIFTPDLISTYEFNISNLQKIINSNNDGCFKLSNDVSIPKIFTKFKTFVNKRESQLEYFDKRELRILSFALSYSDNRYMSIFSKPKELEIVIGALNRNWRDNYLFGLIDCYLKNWDSQYLTSLEIINGQINSKINNYYGTRKTIKSFKDNYKYFNRNNGDLLCGNELALKNKLIMEATKYLSLPNNWFFYPYFSKVILAFYERKKNDISLFIDDLNIALIEHNSIVTNKRVMSKLILQADTPDYYKLQDKVKSMAFSLIGDPGISSYWEPFDCSTEKEQYELNKAKTILNEWITKQFINIFFEKCIYDIRRKKFWLKYAKYIKQFKVFGPRSIKNLLKNDQRIKDYIDARFQVTTSNRETAAFLIIINNYKLIEFSNPGYAFYAYKINNKFAPSIDNIHYHSVDSFRNGSLPMLVNRNSYILYNYSEEGRLTHQDGDMKWEDVFSEWISKIVGING